MTEKQRRLRDKSQNNRMKGSKKSSSWISTNTLVTIAIALIGFPIGYNATIVSGAMLIIREKFNLNLNWQELIASIVLAAAAIFGLVSGWLNQIFGRKKLISASCALFILGAILVSMAYTKQMIVVGRFIQGVAAGISTTTIPAHIAEISQTKTRGVMLTLFPLSMALGQVVSGICAASFSYVEDSNLNWRLMLSFGTLPIVIQLFALSFVPESPTWLISKGLVAKAQQTLVEIHGHDRHVVQLVIEKVSTVQKRKWKDRIFRFEKTGTSEGGLLHLFKIKETRRALIIGCLTQILQQLTGITCVLFYYGSIIKMSGVNDRHTTLWLATLPGMLSLIGGVVGTYLIEKMGRKGLLILSSIGSVIGLMIMGIGFLMISNNSMSSADFNKNITEYNQVQSEKPDTCASLGCDLCSYQANCGFCETRSDAENKRHGHCVSVLKLQKIEYSDYAAYGACAPNNIGLVISNSTKPIYTKPNSIFQYGFCTTSYSWIPVLGSIIFLSAFSAGFAAVPYAINAEIYPDWARSYGMSISTFINCLFCWITASSFLSLSTAITRHGLFFFFTCISAVGTIVIFLFIPETKGMSIDEIQTMLKGRWLCTGSTARSTPLRT